MKANSTVARVRESSEIIEEFNTKARDSREFHRTQNDERIMQNEDGSHSLRSAFCVPLLSGYILPMPIRILCLGDIVGRPGRQVVHDKLPALVRDRQVDLVIANAENIAGGSGITQNLFHKIRSYGVDVVTLGDHIYRKVEIVPTLQTSERVVRPANLSSAAAGRTFTVVNTNSGVSVAVFSLMGRIFMNLPSDDPFAAADRVLGQIPRHVRICVCDVHAEASSEKVALGWGDSIRLRGGT